MPRCGLRTKIQASLRWRQSIAYWACAVRQGLCVFSLFVPTRPPPFYRWIQQVMPPGCGITGILTRTRLAAKGIVVGIFTAGIKQKGRYWGAKSNLTQTHFFFILHRITQVSISNSLHTTSSSHHSSGPRAALALVPPEADLLKPWWQGCLVALQWRIRLPGQETGFDPWSEKILHAVEQISPRAPAIRPLL